MAPSLLSRRLLSRRFAATESIRRLCSATPDALPSADPTSSQQATTFQPRQLEGGMDAGVYRAILVGKAGQPAIDKELRSGRRIIHFSLGTGGIRNNRRPLPNERPEEYANRCSVQWHRVCVYAERLQPLAMQHVKPGAIIYLEGTLETKVFTDPVTGLVKRIREIALRGDGRLLYVGSDNEMPEMERARGVGYY